MSYGATTVSLRDRFASRLRSLRLSAKEIARSTGASPRSVESWRAAESAPSFESLAALCRQHDDLWREFCAICDRPATVTAASALLDEFIAWRRERSTNGEG